MQLLTGTYHGEPVCAQHSVIKIGDDRSDVPIPVLLSSTILGRHHHQPFSLAVWLIEKLDTHLKTPEGKALLDAVRSWARAYDKTWQYSAQGRVGLKPQTTELLRIFDLVNRLFFLGKIEDADVKWEAGLSRKHEAHGYNGNPRKSSTKTVKIRLNPADAQGASGGFTIMGILIHECIHAFFWIWSYWEKCESEYCRRKCLTDIGKSGHGRAWLMLATHIQTHLITYEEQLSLDPLHLLESMKHEYEDSRFVLSRDDIRFLHPRLQEGAANFYARALAVENEIGVVAEVRPAFQQLDGQAQNELRVQWRKDAFSEEHGRTPPSKLPFDMIAANTVSASTVPSTAFEIDRIAEADTATMPASLPEAALPPAPDYDTAKSLRLETANESDVDSSRESDFNLERSASPVVAGPSVALFQSFANISMGCAMIDQSSASKKRRASDICQDSDTMKRPRLDTGVFRAATQSTDTPTNAMSAVDDAEARHQAVITDFIADLFDDEEL